MAKRAEGASVKFDGISFRLNEKERRILAKKAEDLGETPSKTAKLLALEGKIKVMFKDKTAKEIITSLSRIGNNINQVAKKLNTDNVVDDGIKSQFTQIQSDLDIIMDFFILGKKPPKSPTTEMKKETTSETLPQEIDIFSSSPSVTTEMEEKNQEEQTKETEMKENKVCAVCGQNLKEGQNERGKNMACPLYFKDGDVNKAIAEKHTIIYYEEGV